ncbi:MAG: hypothetical protein HQL82_15695 [Magnetococcales bacterium]|nr:hypothetical protein [Magnetococcales bacterium]
MTEQQNDILLKFIADFDARITKLQEDVLALGTRVEELATGSANSEEAKKKAKALEDLQTGLRDMQEKHIRSGQHLSQIERRVEAVKSESSFGVVTSIVIFAILFIVSLVIRD